MLTCVAIAERAAKISPLISHENYREVARMIHLRVDRPDQSMECRGAVGMRTWGDVFHAALRRGEDHGYAAHLADRWHMRNDKLTPQAVKRMSLAEFKRRFGFHPSDALEKYWFAGGGERLNETCRAALEAGVNGKIDLSDVRMD